MTMTMQCKIALLRDGRFTARFEVGGSKRDCFTLIYVKLHRVSSTQIAELISKITT